MIKLGNDNIIEGWYSGETNSLCKKEDHGISISKDTEVSGEFIFVGMYHGRSSVQFEVEHVETKMKFHLFPKEFLDIFKNRSVGNLTIQPKKRGANIAWVAK